MKLPKSLSRARSADAKHMFRMTMTAMIGPIMDGLLVAPGIAVPMGYMG